MGVAALVGAEAPVFVGAALLGAAFVTVVAFVGAAAAAFALPICEPVGDTKNQMPALPCPLVSPGALSPVKEYSGWPLYVTC